MSDHHVLETVTTNKICLSAFDNKRFILPCGTKTLPFGHYETVDCGVDEIDWGSDDIQWDNGSYSNLLLSSSPEWDNDFVVSPNFLNSRSLSARLHHQLLGDSRPRISSN